MSLKLEPKKEGDGKTVILRYAYTNRTRKYFHTGVIIPIEDFKKGVLQKAVRSSNPNCAHFNRVLDQVYTRITTIEMRLKREDKVPTGDLVFKLYHQVELVDASMPLESSMIALFEQFLQAKGYDFNTHKLFKTLQKHLECHFGALPITEFDLGKWNGFRAYLSSTKNLSPNTVCIRLAKLRTFLKFCKNEGHEIPIKSFPLPKEEIKQVYLDFNSLQAIRDFQPPTEALSITKDLCLFQCFTGLRVSDLFRVAPHHIHPNGDNLYTLSMKSHKTNTQMTIPLSAEALKILQKHSFKLPVVVEQYYNRQLKKLAKMAGVNKIWEWPAYNQKGEKYTKVKNLRDLISSHACSRTAFTYLIEQGYPLDQLCIITGKAKNTVLQYYYGKSSIDSVLHTQKRIQVLSANALSLHENNSSTRPIRVHLEQIIEK